MYQAGSNASRHHIATYGRPSAWPYDNFIDGARDLAGNFVKFAPKLKSAGGKFGPDEWVQLFVDAGARFAGPVAEHHDGFSLWDSQVNEWNSVKKGPGLDLLRLFSTAIRARGLKLLVAMHHAYNFTGFYEHVPTQTDPSLRKLYGQLGAAAENQLWFDKLKEVIDRAGPTSCGRTSIGTRSTSNSASTSWRTTTTRRTAGAVRSSPRTRTACTARARSSTTSAAARPT